MEKEFGRLSTAQLRELIGALPKLLEMIAEAELEIARAPVAKRNELLGGDLGGYCHIYEAPFSLHLAVLVVALNRETELSAMASAQDPQEALLAWLRSDADDEKPHKQGFDIGEVIALVYALGRSMVSMATYGRSISSLLEEVREQGNADALFDAIRMDRAVIGCPSAMTLIARAQISGDKKFFRRLGNALDGPAKTHMPALNRMRYVLILLREMGIDDLSQAELHALMVDKLDVYSPGTGDAKRNLWVHYSKSRKLRSI